MFSLSLSPASIASFTAIISIVVSLLMFISNKRKRINNQQPRLEPSNSYGAYSNSKRRIPSIHIEIKNLGEKAIVYKIEHETGLKISCPQLNETIKNGSLLELILTAKNKVKHEDLSYIINIYLKNIDNKIFKQTIKGEGIHYTITIPKKKTMFF